MAGNDPESDDRGSSQHTSPADHRHRLDGRAHTHPGDPDLRSLLPSLYEDCGCRVVLFDAEARIVEVNEVARDSLPEVPLIGRTPEQIFPAPLGREATAYVLTAVEEGVSLGRFFLDGTQWQSTARRIRLWHRLAAVVCVGRVASEPLDLDATMALLTPGIPREIQLGPLAALSDREFEVFLLIGSGASDREVATVLHRSIRTVHAHRRSIGRKLGFESRVAIAAHVARFGLRVNWEASGEPAPD